MGHHVEDVGLDHVLGLDPGGNHVGIHIRFDLSAHAEGGRDVLLQLVLGSGIAEVGNHVDVVHVPTAVDRYAPEIEVVLGAVEVAARLGVACAHVEGETDPPLARARVERPVPTDYAARKVRIISGIKPGCAEITCTVCPINGVGPQIETIFMQIRSFLCHTTGKGQMLLKSPRRGLSHGNRRSLYTARVGKLRRTVSGNPHLPIREFRVHQTGQEADSSGIGVVHVTRGNRSQDIGYGVLGKFIGPFGFRFHDKLAAVRVHSSVEKSTDDKIVPLPAFCFIVHEAGSNGIFLTSLYIHDMQLRSAIDGKPACPVPLQRSFTIGSGGIHDEQGLPRKRCRILGDGWGGSQ